MTASLARSRAIVSVSVRLRQGASCAHVAIRICPLESVIARQKSGKEGHVVSRIERARVKLSHMEQNRAILIAGPTAIVKPALAIAIAKSCGGTIINDD